MLGATAGSRRLRVFAYGAPCDMRKSFLTLSGLVGAMGHVLTAGDMFLFTARNRKRCKVLWHDGTGLCMLAKRLDSELFAPLWDREDGEVELTTSELQLYIEGCKVVGRMTLSPPPIDITKASRVAPESFL